MPLYEDHVETGRWWPNHHTFQPRPYRVNDVVLFARHQICNRSRHVLIRKVLRTDLDHLLGVSAVLSSITAIMGVKPNRRYLQSYRYRGQPKSFFDKWIRRVSWKYMDDCGFDGLAK